MPFWPWIQHTKRQKSKKDIQSEHHEYDQYTAYSLLLDRNGQWISAADAKAGIILAFVI